MSRAPELRRFGRLAGVLLMLAGALVALDNLRDRLRLPPADAPLAEARRIVVTARYADTRDDALLWIRDDGHESALPCDAVAALCARAEGRPLEGLELWVLDTGWRDGPWVLQARAEGRWLLTLDDQRLVRTRLARQALRTAVGGLCVVLIGLLLLIGVPGHKASQAR